MKMFKITNTMLVAALLASSTVGFAMEQEQPASTTPVTEQPAPATPVAKSSLKDTVVEKLKSAKQSVVDNATSVKGFLNPAQLDEKAKAEKIAKLQDDSTWTIDKQTDVEFAYSQLSEDEKKATTEKQYVQKARSKASLFAQAKAKVQTADVNHPRLVRYSAIAAGLALTAVVVTGAVFGAKKLYNWIKGRKSLDVIKLATDFRTNNLTAVTVEEGAFSNQFIGQVMSDDVFALITNFDNAFALDADKREAAVNKAFDALVKAVKPESVKTEDAAVNNEAKKEDKAKQSTVETKSCPTKNGWQEVKKSASATTTRTTGGKQFNAKGEQIR